MIRGSQITISQRGENRKSNTYSVRWLTPYHYKVILVGTLSMTELKLEDEIDGKINEDWHVKKL